MKTITFTCTIQIDFDGLSSPQQVIKDTVEILNLDAQRAGYASVPQVLIQDSYAHTISEDLIDWFGEELPGQETLTKFMALPEEIKQQYFDSYENAQEQAGTFELTFARWLESVDITYKDRAKSKIKDNYIKPFNDAWKSRG